MAVRETSASGPQWTVKVRRAVFLEFNRLDEAGIKMTTVLYVIQRRNSRTSLDSGDMGMSCDDDRVIPKRHRYPHSIVWTPLPCITWLFPVIGHMGIGTTSGVVRDFAGSYFVSEDNMAFGWPTRFWQLDLSKVPGGASAWDKAVAEASVEYGNHMHNLFCDNCHSHVALALNKMGYDNSRSWNMFTVAAGCIFKGKFIGISGFLKQWLPFAVLAAIVVIVLVIMPVINA